MKSDSPFDCQIAVEKLDERTHYLIVTSPDGTRHETICRRGDHVAGGQSIAGYNFDDAAFNTAVMKGDIDVRAVLKRVRDASDI